MNVTLIGMAGAGKSYVGKRLAKKLGYDFLDIDEVMEDIHKKELEKVLEDLGDEKFIESEGRAIIDSTKGKKDHVFSPGGSSIYEPDAMEHLQDISKIIYLRVPFGVIQKRIGTSPERMGRIVGLGKKTFRQLYGERTALYEKYADHTVDVGPRAKDAMDIILKLLER